MNIEQLSTGQTVKYLFKAGGKDIVVDARILGFDGSTIRFEFLHPPHNVRHIRTARTPGERARLSPDGNFPAIRRGAPKGNQYARKAESDRGINVSFYLGSRELETLRLSLQYEQREPTIENVRAKVRTLAQDAISIEVRRTFARFASEHGE